jgi:acetyl-CoA carboxylase biotin carboxyl carrier protein
MSGIADQIPLLSRWLEGTDIELLELTIGEDVIRLRQDTFGQFSVSSGAASTVPFEITAPSVGIFRRTHPSRSTPLVQYGQMATAGDPVGLLQIGALLVHVVAPRTGTVSGVLVEDGATVGYGTALVRLTESAEQ